jgi:RNA 2',3'-cyclic 3'-phosphodiesterase
MRLFLAIDLDDAARAAAARWASALSARLGAAAREIKWVEMPNLHLSLHFFGELSDDRRDAMRRALAIPFETRAFHVALSGAGTFPPSGQARVIWLGVRDGDAAMQTIYATVQTRLEPLGLQEQSARGFTPHLTIGRIRTPGGALSHTLREALRSTPAPSSAFHVPRLTLYQSRLSPKGPTYVAIDHFALPG